VKVNGLYNCNQLTFHCLNSNANSCLVCLTLDLCHHLHLQSSYSEFRTGETFRMPLNLSSIECLLTFPPTVNKPLFSIFSPDLHYSWGASDDSITNWRTPANNNGC